MIEEFARAGRPEIDFSLHFFRFTTAMAAVFFRPLQ